MAEHKMKTVYGLFKSLNDADAALEELYKAGYARENINFVSQERVFENTDFMFEGDDAADGAKKGAEIGAWTGGIAGLLAGVGVVTLPVVGPVVAAGTIASAVLATAAGAGAGAVGGGLLGYLIDAGVGKDDAEVYAEGVKRGGILISVDTANPSDVQDIFMNNNAVDTKEESKRWRSEGWDHYDADDYSEDYPAL